MSVHIVRSVKRTRWLIALIGGAIAVLISSVASDHARVSAMTVEDLVSTAHADVPSTGDTDIPCRTGWGSDDDDGRPRCNHGDDSDDGC